MKRNLILFDNVLGERPFELITHHIDSISADFQESKPFWFDYLIGLAIPRLAIYCYSCSWFGPSQWASHGLCSKGSFHACLLEQLDDLSPRESSIARRNLKFNFYFRQLRARSKKAFWACPILDKISYVPPVMRSIHGGNSRLRGSCELVTCP